MQCNVLASVFVLFVSYKVCRRKKKEVFENKLHSQSALVALHWARNKSKTLRNNSETKATVTIARTTARQIFTWHYNNDNNVDVFLPFPNAFLRCIFNRQYKKKQLKQRRAWEFSRAKCCCCATNIKQRQNQTSNETHCSDCLVV